MEEIAGAYRAALDALFEAQRLEDPLPEVARAREAHRRHAPAGSFEGHLFRGARELDREE